MRLLHAADRLWLRRIRPWLVRVDETVWLRLIDRLIPNHPKD